MPRVEENALNRSIKGIMIGAQRRMDAAKRQRRLEGLREFEERYAIDISGRAEEFPSWSEVHLRFAMTHVDATGQRDSWLIRPHFVYGAYIKRGGPVGIIACVTRWDVNKRNETTGCMLAIGALATDQARKFSGELHACFQGYGAPAEVYGSDTEDH